MKKFFLSIVILFAAACKNTPENINTTQGIVKPDSSSSAIAIKSSNQDTLLPKENEITDTTVNYSDNINFDKFHIDAQKTMANAPIDWESLSGASAFKTRITEAYQTNNVNFSGYYIMSVFGCGASCIMGFMVDVRDGKIYDLPLGEENSCLFAEDRALGNATNCLFIAGVCKENPDSNKVYYKAYLWDEDKKEFEKIEAAAFLKKP